MEVKYGSIFGRPMRLLSHTRLGYGKTLGGDGVTVTPHPNDTQYYPLLAPPNQTSRDVTHPSTTIVEVCLTVKF